MLTAADVENRKQAKQFDVRLAELLLPAQHPKSPKSQVVREQVVLNLARCVNPAFCEFVASGGIHVPRSVYNGAVVRTRTRFTLSQQVRNYLRAFVIETLNAHGQSIVRNDRRRIRRTEKS